MSYEIGDIVLWNRKSTPGYYGVIVSTELRPSTGSTPPWRWYKIKFTTPTPPELDDGWFRCDHISIVNGYEQLSKLHKAMIESADIKERTE